MILYVIAFSLLVVLVALVALLWSNALTNCYSKSEPPKNNTLNSP